jgi:Transglutaminase-like superfamily
MTILKKLLIGLLITAGTLVQTSATESADKCFENLPYSCIVKKSIIIPRNQAAAIGRRLGAPIIKLSNNWMNVQGRSIQINIIEAKTERGAIKLHKVLSAMKSNPSFCIRKGNRVIEYVSKDPALALKTSYELGFISKPKKVRYQIKACIAPIDKADYMASNSLFNLFLSTNTQNPSSQSVAWITKLAKRFNFGHTIALRHVDSNKNLYNFTPQPAEKTLSTATGTVIYSFTTPAKVLNVPYITTKITVDCNASGWTPTTRKSGQRLLAATPFWPVNDPAIVVLANKITAKKQTDKQKVQAILQWLTPGRNIKFGGTTGSRWGVKRVLKQQQGQCWDFSDCFITLARAAGVPCRQVAGWLYGTSGHVWAECLIPGKGWQQVDPTGGGRLNCGIYHIPYFTTEDGKMPILYLAMPEIEIIATKH